MQSNYQDHLVWLKKIISKRLTAEEKLFLLRQRLKFENKITEYRSNGAVSSIQRRVKDWWNGK